MDLETEEVEEERDDDLVSDFGAVATVGEDFTVLENLKPAEYDDRFILLGEPRGVEHYIVRKISYRRSLPVTREIWVAIQQVFAMHKSVRLGGDEERKKAIRPVMARRRYCTHSGVKLEGSCYGWGEPKQEQSRADGEDLPADHIGTISTLYKSQAKESVEERAKTWSTPRIHQSKKMLMDMSERFCCKDPDENPMPKNPMLHGLYMYPLPLSGFSLPKQNRSVCTALLPTGTCFVQALKYKVVLGSNSRKLCRAR